MEKLAQLFPERFAGADSRPREHRHGERAPPVEEQTVIEFGTAHEVLFSLRRCLWNSRTGAPGNSDGSLDTRATVVAVRYHGGRKAVAVRFVSEVGNWIIKP